MGQRHKARWIVLGALFGLLIHGCGGTPEKRAIPEAAPRVVADDSKYAAVDRHALLAPAEAERSLDRLAAYLNRAAGNDAEKARLIYRWIAGNIAYDVRPTFFSGGGNRTIARRVLATRKALCDGYSSLFYELARRMGLEARRIRGYSKGYAYFPGKRFNAVNHEWIAVRIDGDWQLIDPTWGAGIIEEGIFVRKFDPTYFRTPPAYFLFDHLPADPEWQLVREKIKLAEFEALPYPGRPLLRNLYRLGFNGSEVRRQLDRKHSPGFPQVHHYDGRFIRIEDAPLESSLENGETYSFSLDAPGITGAVLLNDDRWHDLEREGNRYRTRIRPRAGVLKLSVQFTDEADTYWPLLIYSVN